jgi:hypothetical protein
VKRNKTCNSHGRTRNYTEKITLLLCGFAAFGMTRV